MGIQVLNRCVCNFISSVLVTSCLSFNAERLVFKLTEAVLKALLPH